jgi:uncharacterized membrane protein YjfL (UPF0719 family)
MADVTTDSMGPIPTVGAVIGLILLAGLPFASASISAESGVLRFVLWTLATLVAVYVFIMFRRVRDEHGTVEAIKWIVTGRLPPP